MVQLIFFICSGVGVLVAQSCPTLCDPTNCSPSGSFIHGILQARILEWIAIPFSRGSSWAKDWTQVSCIVGRRFTIWATREDVSKVWVVHKNADLQRKFSKSGYLSLDLSPRESLTQRENKKSQKGRFQGGGFGVGFLWENLRSHLLPCLKSSERGLKGTDHCGSLTWPLSQGTYSGQVLAGSGKLSSLGKKWIWAWTALHSECRSKEIRILGTRWGRGRGKVHPQWSLTKRVTYEEKRDLVLRDQEADAKA